MTTVYFGRNGKALGTDDDYEGSNYHSVEKVAFLPKNFDVVGKTFEHINRVALDTKDERRNRRVSQIVNGRTHR